MKSILTLAAAVAMSAAAYAQDDVDQLKRDHDKQMRDLEKRQKAEREKIERDFQQRIDKLEAKKKPADDLEKRCDELLQQIEKLAAEVRKLRDQVNPNGMKKSAVDLFKTVKGRIVPQRKGDDQEYYIVPDGDDNLQELLEALKRNKNFEFKKIVPQRKGGDDDERREY